MLKKLMMLLCWLPMLVMAEDFKAGKDFDILTDKPKVIRTQAVVEEFFSYGCPWCYRLEPVLKGWLEQHTHTITFIQTPVIFNQKWTYYAKAFYVAQALKRADEFNDKLFKAIQVNHEDLASDKAMITFFTKHGADKALIESAFQNSVAMDLKLKQATAKMARYQIMAVPAFVVNQHYKTDLSQAQNPKRLLMILDYLIQLDAKKS